PTAVPPTAAPSTAGPTAAPSTAGPTIAPTAAPTIPAPTPSNSTSSNLRVKYDGTLTLNVEGLTEITAQVASVLEDAIESVCDLPTGSVTVRTGPLSYASRRRLADSIAITFTVSISVSS